MPVSEHLPPFLGAGLLTSYILAQVLPILGAGVLFAWGPAPRIGFLRYAVAQVLYLFPHLRQVGPPPAPKEASTCATKNHHQRYPETEQLFPPEILLVFDFRQIGAPEDRLQAR